MPPVTKYSKDMILNIGLKLVKNKGIESVSARNIAKELGSSICPVFSCFENMDVLKRELLEKIYEIYDVYLKDTMSKYDKPFKGAGIAYINFAKYNKNYFKALFMGEVNGDLSSLLNTDKSNDDMEVLISEQYEVSKETSRKLHEYCWVFVHGIASMIATDYCNFTDDEISEMLSVQYISLLEKFKKENK